jgi:hypothetical protein
MHDLERKISSSITGSPFPWSERRLEMYVQSQLTKLVMHVACKLLLQNLLTDDDRAHAKGFAHLILYDAGDTPSLE